jgi:hypothetical protein
VSRSALASAPRGPVLGPRGFARAARVLAAAACLAGSVRAAAPAPPASPAAEVAARAARWLWSRQAPDGGWRSETYGLLRSGQSLTPFVLSTLLRVPAEVASPPEGGVPRALAFLRARVDREGGSGRADPMLEDYPTYATSLAALAFARAGGAEADVSRAARWLRSRQFAEGGGWAPEHPAYGAWGMGGPLRRPPHTGHLDLSMTRHALEALAASGAAPTDPAIRAARRFLDRLRGDDGGFHFSTVVLEANKAGPLGGSWRSYGTATADGVLSLLACGVPASDPALRSALEALVRSHRADSVPGFPDGEPRRWERAMTAYYRAAAAAAFARAGVAEAPAGREWRRDLVTAIASEQSPDGSFRNASVLMKEDDPLIATTLALTALLQAMRGSS